MLTVRKSKTYSWINILSLCFFMAPAIYASDVDKLKDLICSQDQIAKFDGSSWVCAADEQSASSTPEITVVDGEEKTVGTVIFIKDTQQIYASYNWRGYDLLILFQHDLSLPTNIPSWASLLHTSPDCSDGPYFPDGQIELFLQPHNVFWQNLVDTTPDNLVGINLLDDVSGRLIATDRVLGEVGGVVELGVPVDPTEYPALEGYYFLYTSKSVGGEWICEGKSAISPTLISVRPVDLVPDTQWNDYFIPPFKMVRH